MPEDVRKLVGRRIRHFREKKGWSQEKLAEMADLDRTYVGRIERGEKNIGVENLVRLAHTRRWAARPHPSALLTSPSG
jgi:transcriptional regulator with XRE-family HTH domain